MNPTPHPPGPPPVTLPAPDPATVEQLIHYGTLLFEQSQLWFGHGTDNAFDEAAELVFFGAGLRHEDAADVYSTQVGAAARAAVLELFERRIRRAHSRRVSHASHVVRRSRVLRGRARARAALADRRADRSAVPAVDRAAEDPPHARHRHGLGLHRHRQRAGLAAGARRCDRRFATTRSRSRRSTSPRTACKGACARFAPMCSTRCAASATT